VTREWREPYGFATRAHVEQGVLRFLDRRVGEVDGEVGVSSSCLRVVLSHLGVVLGLARVDPRTSPLNVIVPRPLDVADLDVRALSRLLGCASTSRLATLCTR
jgi:hypothetical protein